MKASSQDLRQRLLQTVDEGKTQAEAACLLKVSETTVKRYVIRIREPRYNFELALMACSARKLLYIRTQIRIRQRREKGHVRPKPIPGRPPTKRAPLGGPAPTSTGEAA
jgi:hypothetical protein